MLSFRKTLDIPGYRDDPRGTSGSEQCALRLREEFRSRGHSAELYTHGKGAEPWEARSSREFDLAISINCPDGLKEVRAKVRVLYALLNDFTFCQPGFEKHVDLFVSPSKPHLEQVLTNPAWRIVAPTQAKPEGQGRYEPDYRQWSVIPLGCDPDRYGYQHKDCGACGGMGDQCDNCGAPGKVSGRVVYTSSPDRGLHWLLQEWPAIKRAVPHATLRVFYRLKDWLRGWDTQGYWPAVEGQRQRALYIDEALRRLSDPKWGIEIRDSVSRATIERELAMAEVLAYPADTTSWSEGFSCSTLEGCAARACPITTDCDAFGGIYGGALPLTRREGDWVPKWRDRVIRALTDKGFRDETNDKAEAFAKEHTWTQTAAKILALASSASGSKTPPG
jgi:hypothetical protein